MFPPRAPGQTRAEIVHELTVGADAFGIVIVLILVTILFFAAATGPFFQLLSVILSGGTLLFVLHTAAAHRRTVRFARVVVTLAVIGTAAALVAGDVVGETTSRGVGLILATVAPIVILRRIAISPTITMRLVLGALSIYLLFGLAYSYLFPLIGTVTGHAFFVQTDSPTPSDFLYFSYTTLATIGYGDFTAAQSLGRMVAVSEGLVGQLYLVSAVALLVGNVGRQLRPIAEELMDDDDLEAPAPAAPPSAVTTDTMPSPSAEAGTTD
jgi:ion channel